MSELTFTLALIAIELAIIFALALSFVLWRNAKKKQQAKLAVVSAFEEQKSIEASKKAALKLWLTGQLAVEENQANGYLEKIFTAYKAYSQNLAKAYFAQDNDLYLGLNKNVMDIFDAYHDIEASAAATEEATDSESSSEAEASSAAADVAETKAKDEDDIQGISLYKPALNADTEELIRGYNAVFREYMLDFDLLLDPAKPLKPDEMLQLLDARRRGLETPSWAPVLSTPDDDLETDVTAAAEEVKEAIESSEIVGEVADQEQTVDNSQEQQQDSPENLSTQEDEKPAAGESARD